MMMKMKSQLGWLKKCIIVILKILLEQLQKLGAFKQVFPLQRLSYSKVCIPPQGHTKRILP